MHSLSLTSLSNINHSLVVPKKVFPPSLSSSLFLTITILGIVLESGLLLLESSFSQFIPGSLFAQTLSFFLTVQFSALVYSFNLLRDVI